jgi:hypothetical protein
MRDDEMQKEILNLQHEIASLKLACAVISAKNKRLQAELDRTPYLVGESRNLDPATSLYYEMSVRAGKRAQGP